MPLDSSRCLSEQRLGHRTQSLGCKMRYSPNSQKPTDPMGGECADIIRASLKVEATLLKGNLNGLLQHHPASDHLGSIVCFLFCHVYSLSRKRGEVGLLDFYMEQIRGWRSPNSG